jgi:hypothetical protein
MNVIPSNKIVEQCSVSIKHLARLCTCFVVDCTIRVSSIPLQCTTVPFLLSPSASCSGSGTRPMLTGASISSFVVAGAFVLPWPLEAALMDAGTRSLGFATDPSGDHKGCTITAVHDRSPLRTYNKKVFSTKCGTGWFPMSFPGHFSGSHGHKNAWVHPWACINKPPSFRLHGNTALYAVREDINLRIQLAWMPDTKTTSPSTHVLIFSADTPFAVPVFVLFRDVSHCI